MINLEIGRSLRLRVIDKNSNETVPINVRKLQGLESHVAIVTDADERILDIKPRDEEAIVCFPENQYANFVTITKAQPVGVADYIYYNLNGNTPTFEIRPSDQMPITGEKEAMRVRITFHE